MGIFRARTTWFIAGYFVGKHYANKSESPENADQPQKIEGDTKPCLMLMKTLRSGGFILSDDEEKRQLERCERGLADLNSIHSVGDAIAKVKKRFGP